MLVEINAKEEESIELATIKKEKHEAVIREAERVTKCAEEKPL